MRDTDCEPPLKNESRPDLDVPEPAGRVRYLYKCLRNTGLNNFTIFSTVAGTMLSWGYASYVMAVTEARTSEAQSLPVHSICAIGGLAMWPALAGGWISQSIGRMCDSLILRHSSDTKSKALDAALEAYEQNTGLHIPDEIREEIKHTMARERLAYFPHHTSRPPSSSV